MKSPHLSQPLLCLPSLSAKPSPFFPAQAGVGGSDPPCSSPGSGLPWPGATEGLLLAAQGRKRPGIAGRLPRKGCTSRGGRRMRPSSSPEHHGLKRRTNFPRSLVATWLPQVTCRLSL